MSTTDLTEPAAQAAAAAAAEAGRQFTIEAWTLYGIGVIVTALRTYARAKAVGFRNFRADDYLVWGAVLFYTVQSTLAYSVGNIAHGLANNGMTDEERAALSTSDPEYQLRVIGSKIQIAGWTTYSALIWLLKLAMLVFYLRLTVLPLCNLIPSYSSTDTCRLGRRYRMRIWIGFGLVIGTFVASLGAVFLSCIPFSKYWQISPDPGNSCQAAVSLPIIWTSFAANVSTDIYLILIPIPLLWESTLRLVKKIASTIVLGAGIFVLVCATLKSIFVLVDPVNGAQLAGTWGTRETFVAVVTTNLPMIFPLIRTYLKPLWPNVLRSSKNTKKAYKTPSGFRTIGGGHGDSSRRTGPPSANPPTTSLSPNFSWHLLLYRICSERICHRVRLDSPCRRS
ncbi:LOW QUALITY PROTEIN: uncharacterized protein BDZ83DRAFT_724580 [Colletotrichum acutatum]|uniref:Rhodopsin domain-containing protein n=1 Tax=Glomerella acutata TaxID=27357 RepID=A0AAD8U629_GLOAC|nr:LOW QUALITY PROTEIN: uncharacterized protein BDZ83DRAFT_724580 [Colletotrichum acutatum]KAK1707525.1 LOW QUALITY PROTEIN: hypothetical protein BDZ83DRAFT_724580 [Colletotrichum acutatum]